MNLSDSLSIINSGLSAYHSTAQTIAKKGPDIQSSVDSIAAQKQVEIGVKLAKVADQNLGTLIDLLG